MLRNIAGCLLWESSIVEWFAQSLGKWKAPGLGPDSPLGKGKALRSDPLCIKASSFFSFRRTNDNI